MSLTRPWWPLNPPPKGKISSSTSGSFVSKCRPKFEEAAVSLRNVLEREAHRPAEDFFYSMNHWSDEDGETAREDQAKAVMREPMEKEATRSAEVSVYNIRVKVNIDTGVQNSGGTHDEQDGDGVLATNGDEIGRVCVVAGPNDVDECAMVVSEVH